MRKYAPFIISILIPLFFLLPVQIFLDKPMILAERFIKNGGWFEIFILVIYSFLLTYIMLKPKNIIKWRARYWTFFSILFFTQFILGLLVNEKFLMTGKIHLPIPALIIAGPVFRGEGFFMITLLLSTILIAGPTWCSHLCYIGAWDNLASKSVKTQKMLSRKVMLILRYSMILFVLVFSFLLRFFRVSIEIVGVLAIAFGILGILIMIFLSRRNGYMVHCTTYCPIGGIVVLLGKIFPFRVKINTNTCTSCNKCSTDCKYDALRIEDIKNGKAGWNCINSCNHNSIRFSIFESKSNFWDIYIALVVGIHTLFIALARL
jgi:NAD-dependent dihydropyrimidine dehydrogenase PreA subunit